MLLFFPGSARMSVTLLITCTTVIPWTVYSINGPLCAVSSIGDCDDKPVYGFWVNNDISQIISMLDVIYFNNL